jgi:hypothetical protein
VEPIPVPAPPKSSFNKNRPVSDLLLGQLKHFQHVEHKQGIEIDPALARDIHTEAGAARYITQITRAIRTQSAAKPSGIAVVPGATPAAKPASKASPTPAAAGGLALAAAAATPSTTAAKKKSGKRKKS